eukprot:906117_1
MPDSESIRWLTHWDCYRSPNLWWWFTYIISMLSGVSNTVLLSMSIHQLFIRKDSKLDKFISTISYKILYIFTSFLYVIGPLGFVFAFSAQYGCLWLGEQGRRIFATSMIVSVQSMTISTELLYLFFVFRVKSLFDDITALKLTRWLYSLLLFGFVIQITCQIVSFCNYMDSRDTASFEQALQWGYVALSANIVFVVILLVIFVRKIYLLIRTPFHHGDTQFSSKIINFAIRYLWLAVLALVSTNLVNLTNVFRSYEYMFDMRTPHTLCLFRIYVSAHSGFDMTVMMIKNMLLVIDSFANLYCLYLQFPFANTLYDKMCGCCHLRWLTMFGSDLDTTTEEVRLKAIDHTMPTTDTCTSTIDSGGTVTLKSDMERSTVTEIRAS